MHEARRVPRHLAEQKPARRPDHAILQPILCRQEPMISISIQSVGMTCLSSVTMLRG